MCVGHIWVTTHLLARIYIQEGNTAATWVNHLAIQMLSSHRAALTMIRLL